ncbi:hypothetical protein BUQ74_19905 [Leptospira weilii serovar Heyan]|nr:hypothetical protein BUQ74_19905 [Leptospira weilii serovar Heyan]
MDFFPLKTKPDGNVGREGESNYPPATDIRLKIKMNDMRFFQMGKLTFLSFSKELSMKPSSFEEFLTLPSEKM